MGLFLANHMLGLVWSNSDALVEAFINGEEKGASSNGGGALSLALWLSLAGALVLGISFVIEVPVVLGVAAVILFLAGSIIALVLAYREARSDQVSMPRALWKGLNGGARWLLFFLP